MLWWKFRIRIQSKSIRAISSHSEICFRIIPNQSKSVLNLVRCKSVKNQSDPQRFHSKMYSEWIGTKFLVWIDPNWIFHQDNLNKFEKRIESRLMKFNPIKYQLIQSIPRLRTESISDWFKPNFQSELFLPQIKNSDWINSIPDWFGLIFNWLA